MLCSPLFGTYRFPCSASKSRSLGTKHSLPYSLPPFFPSIFDIFGLKAFKPGFLSPGHCLISRSSMSSSCFLTNILTVRQLEIFGCPYLSHFTSNMMRNEQSRAVAIISLCARQSYVWDRTHAGSISVLPLSNTLLLRCIL